MSFAFDDGCRLTGNEFRDGEQSECRRKSRLGGRRLGRQDQHELSGVVEIFHFGVSTSGSRKVGLEMSDELHSITYTTHVWLTNKQNRSHVCQSTEGSIEGTTS